MWRRGAPTRAAGIIQFSSLVIASASGAFAVTAAASRIYFMVATQSSNIPPDNGQFRLSILSDEGSTIGCEVHIDVNCVIPADVDADEYSEIFFDAGQVRDMTIFFSQGKSTDEVWATDQTKCVT